jgi:hypothetical protein
MYALRAGGERTGAERTLPFFLAGACIVLSIGAFAQTAQTAPWDGRQRRIVKALITAGLAAAAKPPCPPRGDGQDSTRASVHDAAG